MMKFKKNKKILILSLFTLFLFTITSLMNVEINSNTNNSNQQIDEDNNYFDLRIASPYPNITAEEAYNMINDDITYPDLIVLDVRSQSEYDTNHLCDAILIPHTELDTRISELESFNETEIIVYCGSGVRSVEASGILESHDFTKVFNMLGGIAAWISEDYEVCPLNSASFWDLTGNPIEINGTANGVGAHNWTWAESQEWCNGYGNITHPYIIENVTINGLASGSCISIYNSIKYLTIRNCTLYNSGATTYDSGIRLENVTNGNIINNNCSNNDSGIFLKEGNNVNITENYAVDNGYAGVFLDSGTEDCIISENSLHRNDAYGIVTRTVIGCIISRNNLTGNGDGSTNRGGIGLFGTTGNPSKENIITENIINENDMCGIYCSTRSSNNSIYKNYFTLNTIHAKDYTDLGYPYEQNYWNTSIIGNYWDNYTDPAIGGKDDDGDGIGDVPYTYIVGTVNSNDSRPIYGDPFHYGTKIHIDGNLMSGNKSWTWISTRAWCSGSGGSDDPYIISDLIIDAENDGSCILIGNSTVNFKIENCTLKNPGVAVSDACIEFEDTDNGILSLNRLSSCDYGMYLVSSDNHLIINNTINYYVKCIEEIGCTGNTIENNTCIQPVTWDETPTDQTIEYNAYFQYDLNATSAAGIDHWEINNTDFVIDGDGIITNNTLLDVGIHWLRVKAVDVNSYYCAAIFNVNVSDPLPPTWIDEPSDQFLEYGNNFYFDANATDLSGISDWWLNDTTYFAINDTTGIITNTTLLALVVYSLEVRAYDPYSYYCSANFSITVQDTTGPTWDFLPINQNVEFGDSFNYDLDASDASGIPDWWLNDTSYFTINDTTGIITNTTSLSIGDYWLEARAYDPFGFYCSANFSITVQDTTDPTWGFVSIDQIIEFGDGLNYDLDASDVSGISDWWLNDTTYFTINDTTGIITNTTSLNVGVYLLEVRAYDPSSNNCTADIKITVEDTTDPTWDFVPIDQITEFGSGFNYDLDASDASGIFDWWLNDTTYFTINDANGIITNNGLTPVGIHYLEVRAYDPSSNYCTADIKITVEDTTDPTWDFLPINQNLEFGDSFNYDLDASDASGIFDWWLNDTTYFTINDANGIITNSGLTPVGVHYLEVRAYDQYSNNCTADIKITVEDTTNPTWDFVPIDQIIEFGDGLNYDLDATDASGISDWWLNDTTYFTINDVNGIITNTTILNIGDYWLEVRAYDQYSNNCTASIKITVEDTTDPTWDFAPIDQSLEFGDSFNYDLNASDASGISDWWLNDTTYFTINDANGVITNSGLTPVGIHYLEVRAYDPSSNNCTADIKITVEDTTDPTWDFAPIDQSLEFGDSFNYDLDASDASGIPDWWLNDTTYFTINDTNGIITNSGLTPVGVHYLEVRAYDQYSNNCTADIKITVEDTTDPTWDFAPIDQNLDLGDGLNYDLDASDASGIFDWWLNDTSYFTINDANGIITNTTSLNVGAYWLEVRAYDQYSNYATAMFRVIVQDTDDPVWVQLPVDQNLEFGDGLNYDLDAIDTSGISDWWLNDTTYFTINDTNGVITNNGLTPVGIHYLEVRAYDPYNQFCSATFKITVEDTTDPTWDFVPIDQSLELGDSFNYDLDASDASGIPDWWLNDTTYFTINDANGIITNIGQVPVGVHYLEVRAYDPSSNNCTADIKITVEDTTNPTWDFAPIDQNLDLGDGLNYDLDASDASGISDWWLNDTTYFTINDANGIVTNTTSLNIGVYWIEVRAYDPYTNYATATFRIIVQDTDDPVWVQLPVDQNIEFGDSITYDVNATDTSGISDWWLNDTTYFTINDANGVITNSGLTPVGIHYLEVRAYDPYNQFCSAMFKITVEDTTDPTWDFLPTDQNLEFGDSFNYDVNATDASGISDWWLNDTTYFTVNDANGVITNIGQVPVGIHYLEVRAYDSSSNNCTASIKITVEDTTDPTWDFVPIDQTIEFRDSFNYDLDASDASGIADWWLNDTSYFAINDVSGIITNTTSLNEGIYWLEVRAYDSYGQYCSAVIKITVETSTMPDGLDPTTWIYVIGLGSFIVLSAIIGMAVRKRRTKNKGV